MSAAQFDSIIHEPNRLQICAFLMHLQNAEFQVLRDELNISDSAMSKHIKQLEKASYVRLSKNKVNGRQRTWVHLTNTGREVFKEHVKALKQLAYLSD
jgi:DNA-binding MarR family transcriptional regulator